MRSLVLMSAIACVVFTSGATGQMINYGPDGKKTIYSKFYDAGGWLDEGKLGLQVVVDHEMTSGANAAQATGRVTLYLVNLEQKPTQVRSLVVSNWRKEKSLPDERAAVAQARSRTKVDFGEVPISNYGTDIKLLVQYELDGVSRNVKEFSAQRRTDEEIQKYFGPKGQPPYPWFESPYYPFNPPFVSIE